MSTFSHFSAFFAKQSHKMDKIWSLVDEMRKFLGQKFWSHGTPLGSLGSLSQGDVSLWFDWHYFLVIRGPCDHPVIVALHAQAEILKTAGAWCAPQTPVPIDPFAHLWSRRQHLQFLQDDVLMSKKHAVMWHIIQSNKTLWIWKKTHTHQILRQMCVCTYCAMNA